MLMQGSRSEGLLMSQDAVSLADAVIPSMVHNSPVAWRNRLSDRVFRKHLAQGPTKYESRVN